MSFKAIELHQPPTAHALSESMRSLGYSPETAVADLVDNSIAAKAKNIWVSVAATEAAPSGRVALLDDGVGMDAVGLLNAMRPGSKSPILARSQSDLGRFGLGLKTASFSMCRCLTVATRMKGGAVIAVRWDLEHVAKTDRWELLDGPAPEVEADVRRLLTRTGTLVIWSQLDGIDVKDDDLLRRLREHLGLTFHDFLENGDLQIFTSMDPTHETVLPVPACDPFMRGNVATVPSNPHTLPDGTKTQSFILPHWDKCNEDERVAGALGTDWRDRQGFYVYRSRRLLVAGGWLGLKRSWKKDVATQLSRIRVDFPNSLDRDWKIDVLKSRATPPQSLRPHLMRLADEARRTSTSVFLHRETKPRRKGNVVGMESTTHIPLWVMGEGAGGAAFQVNEAHPIIKRLLLESSGAHAALRLLGASMPLAQIWHEFNQNLAGGPKRAGQALDSAGLRMALLDYVSYETTHAGRSATDVKSDALRIAPFDEHPDLVDEVFRSEFGIDE